MKVNLQPVAYCVARTCPLSVRRVCLLVALGVAVLGSSLSACVGAAESPSKRTLEYDLKAAFLFNFAQFVEWPIDTATDENAPFVIGVLGDDPFGASLDAIVEGEAVRGRRMMTRRCDGVEDGKSCQILFISRSEASRIEAIVDEVGSADVLTVSDTDEFAARGGTIGFAMVQNRLQLQINVVAAEKANLTISSKLLRQAEIVGGAR